MLAENQTMVTFWLTDLFYSVDNGCERSPCQNNATCSMDSGEARCLCNPGYTGRHCQIG